MASDMLDTLLLFGEVNIFLVLAIAIVAFVTLSWVVAKWRASKVQATAGVRATDGSRERAANVRTTDEFDVQTTKESSKQATNKSEGVLDAGNLSSELETVANWHQLGLKLGLPKHELDKIQQDYQGTDQRRLEMLDKWLQRTPNATWRDVANALEQMGENRVAESIHQKDKGGAPSIQKDIQEENVQIAQRNKQAIDVKFATLLMKTCRKLGGRQINMEDLHVFLTPFGKCIPKSSSIHEIFEAITHHKLWDYWNYYLLEGIVQAFAADDQEITSWIETYRQDLQSYKVMTKLIDHIATADFVPTVGESLSDEERPARYDKQYYQELSLKLETNFTDHSLKYIDELWAKFANLYGIPPRVVLLDRIHKGCVSIVWLVPSRLAPQILKAPPPSDEFYHKHEIIKVEFNGTCLYQEEKKVDQETGVFTESVMQVAHSKKDLPSSEVVYPDKPFHYEEPSLSSFRMKKTGDTLLSAQPKAASSTETCNSACEIFQKNVAYLLMTIQDPEIMAEELSAGNAVTSAVVEFANNMTHERGIRTSKLLMAVESQIEVDPGTFDVFLSVLAKRPLMSDLYSKMKKTYTLQTPTPRSFRMEKRGGALLSGQGEGLQLSAVDTYASYLKSVYTREKLPVYDKWPLVKSKKYINLALIEKEDITKREADQFTRTTIRGNIDDIKKSKRATDIGQIAQLPDGSQPKCILVEGAPGVGKSTFVWKLCHKWGKGKSLQQYQLVVLLRLRDKSVRAAKKISDLFQYRDHQIQQAAVEEIEETWGKGVFLLFEGYDELPEKLRTESSVFLDVITGRELPEATVLITSRPWASEFLHRECKSHISEHIEILGFTKDNIQSYLESTTANDPSLLADLKKYISCYPHIGSLMYIPLNSAIVVEVYRNSRRNETLVPMTMAELYSSLVRSLLLRHLLNHPVHGKNRKWRVRSFSDLPQDVYQQLCELGRIAYEGILHDQQVIFCDLPEDFETLGLMQCAPELYADEATAGSYNFLHLTVQEYLAAFHLSQQPVENQIECFRKYKEDNRQYHKQHHFHMVLRFLCGLRRFSGYSSEVLNTLCIEKSGRDSAGVVRGLPFNTMHWLFEAQDNDVIAKLLGSSDIRLHGPYDGVTPFDCFVLGYCVSHSNCTWKIDLKLCNIGDEGVEMLVEMLVRGAVEEETHCTGGISEINLMRNNITSEGVKPLSIFPNQLLNKLETLNLDGNNLDLESCATLAHLVPHMAHLKELNLSKNYNIGPGGAVPLITSLTTHNSLEKLVLEETGIGVEDCRALSELLSSSTSLKQLYIGINELPPEAVEQIISGLHHNTSLERLIMWFSHFSLQNTISLASVLMTNHTLVHLSLALCDIDSDGACQLASALCTNDTLQELGLSGNPVGVEGAAAVANMLHTNKSLKMLSIQDNSIGEEGTKKLIDSLARNTTMKELKLPKYESSIASSKVDSRVIVEYTVIFG